MTTPTLPQAAQIALDALVLSSTDASRINPHQQHVDAAITALREALAAPMPEPVARCILDNGDEMGSVEWLVRPRSIRLDHGSLLYAAPPAAPADDHATPSGGQEAGPQEDRIEAAYWRFDARHKGYSQWKTAPMSERDAFKAEMRNALEAEKVRAEMRLVARGWRRPDAPAAPAPAAPVPDGWVMVPMEPTPEMIAAMPYPANTIPAVGVACYRAMITASPAAPAAPVVPLTDSELAKIAVEDEFLLYCGQDSFNEIARAIEAAHGIIGGKP